jgi:hypothetical protein
MRIIVLLLSVFAATMGVLAVFAPGSANQLARMFIAPTGFYITTAIRLGFGVGLLVLADTSRAPLVFRVFGAIILLTGIAILVLGLERHRRIIDWWLSAGRTTQFAWGLIALAFSLFLIYAII